MSFVVAQELTTHLRMKKCKFGKESTENDLKCKQCPFSSNSSSELLFHETLHNEPIIYEAELNENKNKQIHRYKCPICHQIFPKGSLLGHIRQHTQEKPFTCNICDKSFARKNNLQYHIKHHDVNRPKKIVKKNVSSEKPFLCSTCGSKFSTRYCTVVTFVISINKPFTR